MVYSFADTKAGYAKLWDAARIVPKHQADAEHVAALIVRHRDVYAQVEAATGVPWFLVGVLHYRESGNDFHTHLHNGDPLTARTHHVPAGRPIAGSPPFTWMESAIDALTMEGMAGMDAAHWTIERLLYWIERYNGQGYFSHGNSPYVWNWTDQYAGGKFIADHVYSATTWDVQGGCAAVLKVLEAQGIVKFNREGAVVPTQPKVKPVTIPAVLPVDQIESLVENVLERFGGIVVKFIPAGPGKDMLNLVLDRLPDIELELKLESVREHIKDPAAQAAALGQVARNWADKINPPAAAPSPAGPGL